MQTNMTVSILILTASIGDPAICCLSADMIIKKDRERIEGEITEQGPSYSIATPDGKKRLVTKSSVREVFWGGDVSTLIKTSHSLSIRPTRPIAIENLAIPPNAHAGPFTLRHLLRLPEDYTLAGWHCLSVGSEGKLVAVATRNKCVLVLPLNDLSNATTILEGEDAKCVEFYPEKAVLLACGTNKAVHLVIAPDWKLYHSLKECHSAEWLSFRPSKSGRLMAVSGSNFAVSPNSAASAALEYIWHPVILRDGKGGSPPPLVRLSQTYVSPGIMTLSPKGAWLAKLYKEKNAGSALALFAAVSPRVELVVDMKNLDSSNLPKLIDALTDPRHRPKDMAFRGRGFAAPSDEDGAIALPTFSPDESMCLAGGYARRNLIVVWDMNTGKVACEIPSPEREGSIEPIRGLSFSGDGRWLTAGWGRVIGVWEIAQSR
jgi:WD40 repeat protein